jgi:hypothetical protein
MHYHYQRLSVEAETNMAIFGWINSSNPHSLRSIFEGCVGIRGPRLPAAGVVMTTPPPKTKGK